MVIRATTAVTLNNTLAGMVKCPVLMEQKMNNATSMCSKTTKLQIQETDYRASSPLLTILIFCLSDR